MATSFRGNGNGYAPRVGGVSHVQLPLPLAHSAEHGEVFASETYLASVISSCLQPRTLENFTPFHWTYLHLGGV